MRPPENEILRDLPTFYAVQVLADALHVLFTFKLKLFGSVPCKIPDFPFPAHFKMLQLENAVMCVRVSMKNCEPNGKAANEGERERFHGYNAAAVRQVQL